MSAAPLLLDLALDEMQALIDANRPAPPPVFTDEESRGINDYYARKIAKESQFP